MSKLSKKLAIFFCCCLVTITTTGVAQGQATLEINKPIITASPAALSHRTQGYVWRLDAKATAAMPRNYRIMDSIRMSGSGQFTPSSYQAMLMDLRVKHKVKLENLYVFDLRQESHGFMNGAAVSWYGEDNWANVGKSPKKIAAEEKYLLKNTYKNGITNIYKLDSHKVPHLVEGVLVTAEGTEQELVEKSGAHYIRITCSDHLWPEKAQREEFLQIYKNLPAKAWVHFHCQAGIGRTTSFMAMYDILKNGHKDSLETIVERQRQLGGQDLLHVYSTEAWRQAINDDKAQGVKAFYEEHKK